MVSHGIAAANFVKLLRLPLKISERKALLTFGDILLVNGATLVALWLGALRSHWPFSLQFLVSHIYWFLFLTVLWLILGSVNDLYSLKIAADAFSSAFATLKVTSQALLVYFLIYFLSPPQSLPRHVIVFFAILSLSFLVPWRSVYAIVLSATPFQPRAIIVGAGRAGRIIVQAIRDNLASGYQLVGYVDDDPAKQGQAIEGLPVIGTSRDLVSLVKARNISEVILAITHDMHGTLLQALMDCQEQGVRITLMRLLYEEITGKVPVEHLGDQWPAALPMDHASTGSFFPLLKRAIDVIISGIGIVILAFIFPVIALAIYIDSPGPIFYAQERVGKGGKIFCLVKFRSMIPNAEEGAVLWAGERDVRVTRVGRFLRTTHIDELPQFINIFRGEMSVVGPRPERPEFVAELEKRIPFYRLRHAVRPGMAGWALVKYGYGSSVEDVLIKLEYDLYYIKHQSIYLDLLILLKTIGTMLLFRGR